MCLIIKTCPGRNSMHQLDSPHRQIPLPKMFSQGSGSKSKVFIPAQRYQLHRRWLRWYVSQSDKNKLFPVFFSGSLDFETHLKVQYLKSTSLPYEGIRYKNSCFIYQHGFLASTSSSLSSVSESSWSSQLELTKMIWWSFIRANFL